MARLFAKAGGAPEVVHASFVAPCVDRGGHVGVADRKVLAGGPTGVFPAAVGGPGGGCVGEGGVPG